MPEQLRNILERIKDWWMKFDRKQKILIISVSAAVLIAIIALAVITSRPTMIVITTCEDAVQATEVKNLLEDNAIEYELSSDGLSFTINQKDEANARMILGAAKIKTSGFTIADALDGSFTTTERDKQKKYQLYLENKFEETIEILDNVKSAKVNLSIPEQDGTLAAKKAPSYGTVVLTLSGELTEEQAAGIASFLSTSLGNDGTDTIKVMDNKGNVLFSGDDEMSVTGQASSQLTLRQKYEQSVKKQVKDVMLGTDLYSNVEVGLNLDMTFDTKQVSDHEFYVPEGNSQGYLDSESNYESTATGGLAAVPGTDSNDDTTYMLENNNYSESSVTETKKDYVVSERLTKVNGASGNIKYDTSSISVVATTYVTYNEDALKAAGQLKGTTFEEFISQNSDRVKTEVDQDFYSLVSKATGFPVENIQIVAYEVPFFQYSEGSGRTLTDYLQILLTILIFALLGYVVFRSTRHEEIEELEPELSVESLLASTRETEAELEDIGYKEKSEARMLIEKFVDEKPDAVASLLRNWLNEEWD